MSNHVYNRAAVMGKCFVSLYMSITYDVLVLLVTVLVTTITTQYDVLYSCSLHTIGYLSQSSRIYQCN